MTKDKRAPTASLQDTVQVLANGGKLALDNFARLFLYLC